MREGRFRDDGLRSWWWAAAVFVAVGWASSPAGAQCNTAPTAADDVAWTYDQPVLIDVLANDSDPDGQALTVTATGSTCLGAVTVDFELLTFTPGEPVRQDCEIDYAVTDEEGLSASATVAVTFPVEIFADDFEAGDAAAWSACEPSCP